MRFLRNLLDSRNPTREWVRDPSRPLELDLDSKSLSGVPLGAAFDGLEFLGLAQKSKRGAGLWEFSALGVVAEEEDSRIGSLFVVPIPDGTFDVEPYTGVVSVGGQPASISWISREHDVIQAFGKPTRRDEDLDETVLFYEIEGRVEREIELTPEGRIKTIAIYRYSQ